MRLLLLLFVFLTSLSYSQKIVYSIGECSGVTRRFISQHYSTEKQLTIENSPLELSKLEYLCAKSYEVVSGQMVLRSQRELIDVTKYQHLRRQNVRITFFDEYSGLQITLYSWDEIDQNYYTINQQYQLAKQD